jgi:hypothetical protein
MKSGLSDQTGFFIARLRMQGPEDPARPEMLIFENVI